MTRLWTVALALGVVAVAALPTALPVRVDAAGGGGDAAITTAKPEDADYVAGERAIKAGDYARAIPLFKAVVARDQSNADAYNWLAYATRKNGDVAGSIPIYQQALSVNPKHRGAHEYIGEAYLMLGDLPNAKRHLAALDSICFFPCSEYRDLKKAVQTYEKRGSR